MVLKELTTLPGVSGNEDAVRAYILEKVRPLCDRVTVDKMGNVLAYKQARTGASGKRHAMLCAHMDEVGLIIIGINDNGLLSYETIGSIDSRVLVSKRVKIGEKAVPGVIGAKAIHLQSREEMGRVLQHEQLYIDVGAKDKASAEALVSPGDYAHFDSDWVEFGEGLVKAKALDNRVGCAVLLSVLEGEYPIDITCAFTTQEEVGCRGAMAAAFQIRPDCALVLEGTSANDMGDVEEHLQVCNVGKGVAISFMDLASIGHGGLTHALKALADEKKISWQVKRYVSGGNDSSALQRAYGATPCAVLSAPCRYIHSPSSVVSFQDIESMYQLTEAFLTGSAAFCGEVQ